MIGVALDFIAKTDWKKCDSLLCVLTTPLHIATVSCKCAYTHSFENTRTCKNVFTPFSVHRIHFLSYCFNAKLFPSYFDKCIQNVRQLLKCVDKLTYRHIFSKGYLFKISDKS